MDSARAEIERAVEAQLRARMPDVDLRDVRIARAGVNAHLTVVIDHPDGVDHRLCADVTRALDEISLRERYGIEVSSPGPEPPLRTIDHFRSVVGRRVRLRVDDGGAGGRARERTGTLVAADGGVLTLAVPAGVDRIPLAWVRRAQALDGGVAEPHVPRGGVRS